MSSIDTKGTNLIAIVMGSDSDLPSLQPAIQILEEFEIKNEVRILSAHRTPLEMVEFAKSAQEKGFKVIIAGAGGAAHLPGMVAALTDLPVIGVPIQSKTMSGIDSLYSIVQMPSGIPVATVAIGAGINAGLLAAKILGIHDENIMQRLTKYRKDLHSQVINKDKKLTDIGAISYLNGN